MHQHAETLGQDAMRLDGRHAPLGVHAVPCQRVAGGDVQPVQFAGHAQARFVGVQDRRGMQPVGNAVRRRLQGRARFGHPRQQRGRRDREAIQPGRSGRSPQFLCHANNHELVRKCLQPFYCCHSC